MPKRERRGGLILNKVFFFLSLFVMQFCAAKIKIALNSA